MTPRRHLKLCDCERLSSSTSASPTFPLILLSAMAVSQSAALLGGALFLDLLEIFCPEHLSAPPLVHETHTEAVAKSISVIQCYRSLVIVSCRTSSNRVVEHHFNCILPRFVWRHAYPLRGHSVGVKVLAKFAHVPERESVGTRSDRLVRPLKHKSPLIWANLCTASQVSCGRLDSWSMQHSICGRLLKPKVTRQTPLAG